MVKDMTVGSPFRHILNFSIPLLLGSLLQQTYSLRDAAIVGRYLGINALAGVGASSSVIFLILGFCNGCAGGFGIPVAQAFGAKDFSRMRSYVANSYWLATGISIFFVIICCLLCDTILHIMHTPEEIFSDAYSYLLVTFIGIPCALFYNLIASIIRALGDSKTPFYFLLFASILNVILDFICILVFKWGAAGAAIATLIAQGVSAICCYIYMKKNFPLLRMNAEESRINSKSINNLLLMGVPMGLQFSITAIGSIMLQSANNALGATCITAFTTAMRIKMFFMSPLENLGIAMATYVGQNLGARQIKRIWYGIRTSLSLTVIYWLFCAILLWFTADWISSLFVGLKEQKIIEYSALFLHISCFNYIFLGTLTTLRYSLQGIGYTKLALNSGVFEMIARVCVSIWLVPATGFLGVCWGDPIAWMSADCFLIPAMIIVYRKLKLRHNLEVGHKYQ